MYGYQHENFDFKNYCETILSHNVCKVQCELGFLSQDPGRYLAIILMSRENFSVPGNIGVKFQKFLRCIY